MKLQGGLLFLALGGLAAVAGCSRHQEPPGGQAIPVAGPRLHYGALMSEVGRRFELMGRAGAAHRWDLAGFELSEIEEVFAGLPAAEPPENQGEVNLRGIEQAFLSTHPPELRAAFQVRDAAAFTAAFASAASTCNGCHRATGHAFIEIPSQPGAGVPKLDPVP